MRQTNSVITHLSAQYRAILKNAIVTGCATLTAATGIYGLSGVMTDAQAAPDTSSSSSSSSDDVSSSSEATPTADPAEGTWYFPYDTKEATYDEYKSGKYNRLEVTYNPDYVPPTEGGEDGGEEPAPPTTEPTEKTPANVTIKGGTGANYYFSNGIEVNSGASLTIEKGAYVQSRDGAFNVTGAEEVENPDDPGATTPRTTVTVYHQVAARDISIENSDIVIKGTTTAGNDINPKHYAKIYGNSNRTYGNNIYDDQPYNGTFNINKSNVALGNKSGLFSDKEIKVSNSTINIDGETNNYQNDNIKAGGVFINVSELKPNAGGGVLQIDNTDIIVGDNKGGTISANHTSFSGGRLEIGTNGNVLLERGMVRRADDGNADYVNVENYSKDSVIGDRSAFDNSGSHTFNKTNISVKSGGKLHIGGANNTTSGKRGGFNVTFDDGTTVDLAGILNINQSTDTDRTVVEFKNGSTVNNTGEMVIGNGSMLKIEAATSGKSEHIDSLGIDRTNYSDFGKVTNSGTVAVTNGWVKSNSLSDFGVNIEQPAKGGQLQLENNSIVQVNQDLSLSSKSFSGNTAIVQNGSTGSNSTPSLYGKKVTFTTSSDPTTSPDSTNKIQLVGDDLLVERTNPDSSTGQDLVNVTINKEQKEAMVLTGKEKVSLDRVDTSSPAKDAIDLAKRAHELLSDLNFGAEKTFDASEKTDLALKVTNAKIELSNSLAAADGVSAKGEVKTDLYMDSGSALSFYGGEWETQNIVLQNGAVMGISNGSHIMSGGSIEVGANSALAVDQVSNVESQNVFAGPNAAIAVDNGSTLNGQDFLTEDETTINVDHSSTVTGKNFNAGTKAEITVDNDSNLTVDNITFGTNSTIKVDHGSTVKSAKVSLKSGSKLTLDSGAAITSDDVTLDDGAILRVEWNSTGTSKNLNAGNNSNLTIYKQSNWSGTDVSLGQSSVLEVSDSSSLSGTSVTLASGSQLNVKQQSSLNSSAVELGSGSTMWVDEGSTVTADNMTIKAGGALFVDNASKISGNNLVFEASNGGAQQTSNSNPLFKANTIDRGSEVSFNTVNIGSNNALTFNDSTLDVKGDGKTDTGDLIGGDQITVVGGDVKLNKADDTVKLEFKGPGENIYAPGEFSIDSNYTKIKADDGAKIHVDLSNMFAHDAVITKQDAENLRDLLISGTNAQLVLTGVQVDPGFPVTDPNLEVNFDDILDSGSSNTATSTIVTDITKQTTIINMDEGDRIAGGYKAIKTKANQKYINVVDNHTLSLYGTVSGSSNVIEDVNRTVAGVHLENNAVLNLIGDPANMNQRTIGEISGSGTLRVENGDFAFINSDKSSADINVNKLVGRAVDNVTSKITAGKINANNIDLINTDVNAQNVSVSGVGTFYAKNSKIDVSGDLDLSQANGQISSSSSDLQLPDLKQAYGSILESSTVNANSLKAANIALTGGSNVTITSSVNANNIAIIGGSSVTAETVRLNNNRGSIYVGDAEGNIVQGGASNGNLAVTKYIDLNGGSLVIDPDYGSKTSTVFTPTFDPNGTNRFTGNIVVGQNSALGLGGTEENFRKSLANFQVNGSLDPNKYGSYVYLDTNGIDIGKYKLVSGTEDINTLKNIAATSNSSVYMGKGSALEVTSNALYGSSKPVFDNFGNKTVESQGGTLIVPATFDGSKGGDISKLFGSNANLVSGTTEGIKITTPGGAFIGYITNSSQLQGKDEITLTPGGDGGNNPGGGGNGDTDLPGTEKFTNASKDVTKYFLAATVYNEGKSYNTYEDFANAVASSGDAAFNSHGLATVKNEQGAMYVGQVLDLNGGAHIEKLPRLANYAGAVQAANQVSNMTSDALALRMGAHNGARQSVQQVYQGYNLPPREIRQDLSGQGSALWFTPSYRNASSSGFNAGDKNYGNDVNLYGATFGFDYSVPRAATAGAFLTFGTGDVKGSGLGSGVSNDVSYYGGGIYSGFSPSDNVDLLAELSYTKLRNDVKYQTGVKDWNDMSAKFDSSALTFGLGARYTYASDAGTLQPHLGIRYSRLSNDNYDVMVNSKTVASNKNDDMNIISIPVGATLATELRNGNWSFHPSLDLNVTANFGKTEQAGTTRVVGIYGKALDTKTEVIDRVTYGAKLGFTAQSDSVEFGLDVGYTGSENTNELGVNAKVAAHF